MSLADNDWTIASQMSGVFIVGLDSDWPYGQTSSEPRLFYQSEEGSDMLPCALGLLSFLVYNQSNL
jgi:hypothetical protein